MTLFCRALCETSEFELGSGDLNNSVCSLENSSALCSLDTSDRINIFIGLSIATIFASFARALGFIYVCVNASRVLHNRMFGAVLRSPVLFFDTNPIGIKMIVLRFAVCSYLIKICPGNF